jgi:hypothetical protein
MIGITHNNLSAIVLNYNNLVTQKFQSKLAAIFDVQNHLLSNVPVLTTDVQGKVVGLTEALKVCSGIDKLYNSKHPKGKGKDTADLVYTLNRLKIKTSKKSICRKTIALNSIVGKIQYFKTFILTNELFTSLPDQLLLMNKEIMSNVEPLPKRLYDYLFDYQKYYEPINNGIGKMLDLKTCPYCNRNYITYIEDKSKRVIGPSYDHFFLKSKYKYITLSFYNLVPSCVVCNSNLKGTTEFALSNYIHPYIEGFGDNAVFDFNLKPNKMSKQISFEPYLKPKDSISSLSRDKIFGNGKDRGNVSIFKLQEIYKSHSDSVEEIYSKFESNGPYYTSSISEIIKDLKTSEEEFYRFTFRNYFDEKDFIKRPLAKLDKDIYMKMKSIIMRP